MFNRIRHLNGDIFAAVDVETTGNIVGFHEVIQVAILPLDNLLNEIDVLPFYINIKPQHPSRADSAAMRVNRLDLNKLCQTGMDPIAAADLLKDWMDKTLKLGYNKYGTKPCRFRPVGHNYAGYDCEMVRAWLDQGLSYEEFFHPHCHDTMLEGVALNTKLSMRGKQLHFDKVGLNAMCKKMGIEYEQGKHHDALYDTRLTAQLFKKLMNTDFVGLY